MPKASDGKFAKVSFALYSSTPIEQAEIIKLSVSSVPLCSKDEDGKNITIFYIYSFFKHGNHSFSPSIISLDNMR